MAVSRLLPSGGANDFNLAIGGAYTSVTFNKEYASGSYSITSGNNDSTFDIYAYNADGSLAGYTKTNSFSASKGFSKMVVLGGTTSDVLSFAYKTTFSTVDDSDEVTAGPVATSVSPSSVPNIDDTFTLTGRNFAADCTVTFTSANTGYTATQAKGIVRSSATSLIVTRPDNLVTNYSPYTLTIENPGVTNPTGSNSHILSNAITAGTNPAWVTNTPLPTFTRNVSYSTTLVASDTENSDIDYAIVSGSLPTGLSLDQETGVISGTPTSSLNVSFTVRATDAGGNFVDKAFTMPNASPTWVTSAGALTNATSGSAYSYTVSATDDSGTAPTYSIASGSLPSGLSLNATTGVISGTPTTGSGGGTPPSFTLRATDVNGGTADRSFSIYVLGQINTRFTSSGSWTVPTGVTSASFVLVSGGGGGGYYGGSNVGAGGGGAGGILQYTNQTVTPGQVFNFTVGAGANQGSNNIGNNNAGGTTTCGGFTAPNGGGGGGGQNVAGNGGSGGGRSGGGSGGNGTSGQGSAGGVGNDQDAGGGGGGKNAAGGTSSGIAGAYAGDGGAGADFYGFAVGGGGGGGHSDRAGYPGTRGGTGLGGYGGGGQGGSTVVGNSGRGYDGTAGTGGGGGGSGSASGGGTGGSGCVIISYIGQENNGTFCTNR